MARAFAIDSAERSAAEALIAALAERGEVSRLSDEAMAGLFGARALEMAYTMLRESEAQLIKVLTRTEGGGGPAPDLDAEVEKAIALLTTRFGVRLRFESFGDFGARAAGVYAQRGLAAPGEAALRQDYNRQRQIALHRIAAMCETPIATALEKMQPEIDDLEAEVSRPLVPYPPSLQLGGPAVVWSLEAQRQRDRQDKVLKLDGLKRRRATLQKVRDEVESVFPVLGGMDTKALERIATLPEGTPQFDRIRDAQLTRVFNNIAKARQYLYR